METRGKSQAVTAWSGKCSDGRKGSRREAHGFPEGAWLSGDAQGAGRVREMVPRQREELA